MSRRLLFDFLSDLSANNSKEWMDDNRKYYHEARDLWIETVGDILKRFGRYDPFFDTLVAKKTIMRINNNRMFHPDKPVYKDNFAFSPSPKEAPAFYLHVSPSGSFMGGGLWHPDTKVLKQIRAAIDYDAQEVLDIASSVDFGRVYGGLDVDTDALKTSPQGYSRDHEHIDLLCRKNFTALRPLSTGQVVGSDFLDLVEEAFVTIQPLNQWLIRAMSVE